MTEYRRAAGVGPSTNFRNCAIEGGLGRRAAGTSCFSTVFTLTLFGFVAILAFSCSSLASSTAVDCKEQNGLAHAKPGHSDPNLRCPSLDLSIPDLPSFVVAPNSRSPTPSLPVPPLSEFRHFLHLHFQSPPPHCRSLQSHCRNLSLRAPAVGSGHWLRQAFRVLALGYCLVPPQDFRS